MQQYVKLFIFCLALSFSVNSEAQKKNEANYNVNSPYSRIGIGDLMPFGSIRNIGMGGTGVSQSHPEFFNSLNPALLINNRVYRYDSLLNILDGGTFCQVRKVSDQNASQVTGAVNFLYFTYALPVNKRWTAAAGIRPLSNVSFFSESTIPVTGSPGDTAVVSFLSWGGLSQAFLSNAFRIGLPKVGSLFLGLESSYAFGSINRESFSYIRGFEDSLRVGTNQKSVYSGFFFRPGAAFRMPLGPGGKDTAVFFNAGLTYEFFAGMNATERLIAERRTPANLVFSRTTVSSSTQSVNLPSTFRFGISFDKFAKWNYALDFSYSNWSNVKGLSSTDTLANSFTIAAGAEWAIDLNKDEFEEIIRLRRKYLRAGFAYSKTPLVVDGKQVNDISFSLGYTFPILPTDLKNRSSLIPYPKITFAIIAGQRGSLQGNLVKDQYLMGYVGLTINDKWFRKRRIE